MSDENKTPETQQTPPAPKPVAKNNSKNSLGIPIAIVIAALLVAGAILYKDSDSNGGGTQTNQDDPTEQQTPEIVVAPISETDHILGDPNAPIVIVEYSDIDCPFCKNFHETMNQVMAEYGEDGKVAWVYRQFPIPQLHPNAPKIAEATECVASMGGNEAFWKFTNMIFDERGTNELTDMDNLPGFAAAVGVSESDFIACMDEGRFTKKIQDDVQAAVAAGARGTPYSILIAGGQQGVINGAQQYTTVKQMIDSVLSQI